MKITKTQMNSRRTAFLAGILSGAIFLVMNPLSARGEETDIFKKFQFELYASYSSLNPSDLNLFVDYENRIQEFSYDRYLNYLQANGQIRTWTQNQTGERKELQRAFPFGFRLKYDLNKTIAISLGFKYMTSKQESDLDFQYTRDELIEEQYIESLAFSPFSISAKAYIPLVGVHIVKRFGNALELEGYITGGPMFVKCHYLSDWMYEWRIQGPDYGYRVISRTGRLEQNGSGTGIAVDFGGRFNYPIVKIMAIFLEGGYAYQVAKNLSGSGLETQGASNVTWNGTWGIKQETMKSAWGETDLELPTNYWPNNTAEGRARDFKLDLSGFQFRLGLSFRF